MLFFSFIKSHTFFYDVGHFNLGIIIHFKNKEKHIYITKSMNITVSLHLMTI